MRAAVPAPSVPLSSGESAGSGVARERVWDVAAMAALVVIPAFFLKVVPGGVPPYGGDVLIHVYPLLSLLAHSLHAGRPALWNFYAAGGYPLAPYSALSLYPPMAAALIAFPVTTAIAALYVFYLAVFGIGMYLLGGDLGMSRPARLLAAVTLAEGGFVAAHAYAGHLLELGAVCPLPLAFLLLRRAIRRASWRYATWCGVVIGLMILAAGVQFLPFALAPLPLLALWHALSRLPWPFKGEKPYGTATARRFMTIALWPFAALALAGAVAAALGAVFLLPFREILAASLRSGPVPFKTAAAQSLPPGGLLMLIAPNAFGNAAAGTYWPASRYGPYFHEIYAYAGLLPLLLIPVALRRRAAWPYAALAVLAGLVMLGGYTPLYHLIYSLPGGQLPRAPARAGLVLDFALALLAGFGLDALLGTGAVRKPTAPYVEVSDTARVVDERGDGQDVRAPSRTTGGLVGAHGLCALGGPRDVAGNRLAAGPGALRWLAPGAVIALAVAAGLAIASAIPGVIPPGGRGLALAAAARLVVALAVALAGCAIAVYSRGHVASDALSELTGDRLEASDPSDTTGDGRDARAPRGTAGDRLEVGAPRTRPRAKVLAGALALLLPALALLDLFTANGVLLRPLNPATYYNAAILRALLPGASWYRPLALDDAIPPGLGMVTRRVYDTQDPAPLALEDYWTLSHPSLVRRQGVVATSRDIIRDVDPFFLRLFGVRTLLSTTPLHDPALRYVGSITSTIWGVPGGASWNVDARRRTSLVYHDDAALPRTFVVAHAVTQPDPNAALAMLRRGAVDPARTVVLSGVSQAAPGPLAALQRGWAAWLGGNGDDDVNAMSVDADGGTSGGYLVIDDGWFPGWSATVDGRAAPVQRADYLLRAVPLPPGPHRVRLVYAPLVYLLGAAITLATALALLCLAALTRAPRRR